MATANQYPVAPPPPPPPYRERRSIAGPVILIVVGALFLAKNFGWHFPIWRWFGHWWPLLIIAWGLIVLFERMSGRRTRGIGAGAIVLLVLLVVFGLTAHETSDWDWRGMGHQVQIEDDDLGEFFGGQSFTFEDNLEQAFPAKGSLRIVSDRGSLNITSDSGNTIRVVVHKTLYADNQKEADNYNAGTKPQITVNGDSVILNANTDGAGNHGVTADMDITVPAGATVEVAGKRGDVTVDGRKADVKIAVQHGDVTLRDISGAVNVSVEKGSIRGDQIGGDVDLSGHVDSVTLDDVSGAVRLNGDFYEDVRLSKIAKSVTFKTSRSDMEIASVPGELDISSDEVRGSQLNGPTRVVTSSKNIHLEDVAGDLSVRSTNGDVEVTPGGTRPAGRLDVTTAHGAVALTLAGKNVPDNVSIGTEHGDVTLTLTGNAGVQISAATRHGEIDSDFDGLNLSKSNDSSQASGKLGNGNSKVSVATDTGNIRITKG